MMVLMMMIMMMMPLLVVAIVVVVLVAIVTGTTRILNYFVSNVVAIRVITYVVSTRLRVAAVVVVV
jgi:hypothetical protein